jgi:membrane protease YdiL (CAAX protease family)
VALWLAVFASAGVLGRALPGALGWTYVAYDRIAESSETLIQHVLVMEILFAVGLCALLTWLGWWRPVLIERRRVSRWYLLIPGLLIPLSLVSTDWDRLSAKGAGYTAVLALTALLVGFNEELFVRGVLVVGVRRIRSERAVWLWTSLAFGGLHAVNLVVGSPLGSVIWQVVLVTLVSTLFYLARRAAGTVAAAMLLHAAWDFSGFSQPIGGEATVARIVLGLVTLVLLIGSLATARRWLRAPVAV